jgi:hypothetical protein
MMESSFIKTPEEVCLELKVDSSKGLNTDTVKDLLKKYGKNG